ncbi:hypothetical protein [Demequina gelatinilytica]|uniref:hypothetical protein n=1 Tax=Demequina gelatinilytica TaxID=1638980 RepID=UPI00078114D2|nr:hypothetical protein [Demequina gelatinilytica]
MVATVVAIRLRAAWHLARREWWRLLIAGLGVTWMLTMLPWLVWGGAALARQSDEVRADLLVGLVAVLSIGWAVVPLMVAGLDDTLEPARFRTLGVSARTIMPGLTVAAFLTLPALFFALALGLLGLSWRVSGPEALAVAALGLALAYGSMVLGARVSAAWAARVLSSRRAKLATFAVLGLALAAAAPVALVLFRDGLTAVIGADVEVLLDRLGTTPLGAGVAAPALAAEGDWLGAGWRIAMQAAWLLLVHAVWRVNVAHQLVAPLGRGGGARRRHDRILDPVRGLVRPRDGATAAVHARLVRAWVSDPRYLSSLVGVMLLPVTFFALVMPVFDLDPRWAYLVPIVLAVTIGWGRHNDVAFDSTALWLDVVSGRLGQAVLRGRLAATASWALPLIVVVALATVAWGGRWADAPGLLGTCVGVLGVSLGVAALSAVLVPYRAPAPGASPFGSEVGAVGAGLVAQLVSTLVLVLLVPFVVVPFVVALVAEAPGWGAAACVLGIITGIGAYAGGVRAAGAVYNARSGRLLAAVA